MVERRVTGRVLYIEDDHGHIRAVGDRLLAEGYDYDFATDGDSGLRKVDQKPYDVILLDVMLPGKNGFHVARELRSRAITTPIIMLTAKGLSTDKVSGLRIGADDYMVKPFDFEELLARIEAVMRRKTYSVNEDDGGDWLDLSRPDSRFGSFVLKFSQAALYRGDKKIPLSYQEFRLLSYLVHHRGEVVENDTLLEKVWGYESEVTSRTLYVHIAWLRKKLRTPENRDGYIETIRRIGYRFSET